MSSVSFTGTRSFANSYENYLKLSKACKKVVLDENVNTLNFGGADGVDTCALLCCGILLKDYQIKKTIVAIIPDTLIKQPAVAIEAIEKFADQVVEMHNKITRDDGWKSYKLRDQELVDRCDYLYGFPWKKKKVRSGTWMTINMGRRKGLKEGETLFIEELD